MVYVKMVNPLIYIVDKRCQNEFHFPYKLIKVLSDLIVNI